jgi:hypothetical protein
MIAASLDRRIATISITLVDFSFKLCTAGLTSCLAGALTLLPYTVSNDCFANYAAVRWIDIIKFPAIFFFYGLLSVIVLKICSTVFLFAKRFHHSYSFRLIFYRITKGTSWRSSQSRKPVGSTLPSALGAKRHDETRPDDTMVNYIVGSGAMFYFAFALLFFVPLCVKLVSPAEVGLLQVAAKKYCLEHRQNYTLDDENYWLRNNLPFTPRP